ncbi:MAG: Hpt domain-containing protein [Lachnospiraceae bacterium]|nr:Hpt domain-containing protein [Lachnospiraceae bacterium]
MERQVETGMMNREETEREGRPEEDPRLWQMAGIDTAAGLEYAGEDGALYREILAEYISCIEEQAQAVEDALAAEDIETFTIMVHSLKSTSRTIGAQMLSDRARELEEHARRQEWEQLLEKAPQVLADYRGLYAVIAPYCPPEEPEWEKRPADHEAVTELLARLWDNLEVYDSTGAEKAAQALLCYDLEEAFLVYLKELLAALGRFDYEGCREIVRRWREVW